MNETSDIVGRPEFSRIVPTQRLSAQVSTHRITADAAERAALARRFGLISLDRLDAEVRLQRDGNDIRFEAELSADLVQACVVTLEPVPIGIAERFALCYRPGIDDDEAELLAAEDPEADIVEPLAGESIDIGEAVAQQLSIAMEPYPRAAQAPASGADDSVEFAPEASAGRSGPFDILAAMKRQS
jgi:Large ribosomal RNA subunit accumulation protein YceD